MRGIIGVEVIMRRKVFLTFQIAVPTVVFLGLAVYAGFMLLTGLCTDTVPDTDSIFVYAVDGAFEELNRRYAGAKGIVPEDETSMIEYDDIPSIADNPLVKDLYVFDDAALSEFTDSVRAGQTVRVAVPRDVCTYYGDPSGMGYMFGNPDGTETVYQNDYIVLECSSGKCSYSSLEPDFFIYYKYDPSTWSGFISRLEKYIEEEDAYSQVEMLITTENRDDADSLQMQLMSDFPASNYSSAEFASTWKNDYNNEMVKHILIILIAVMITMAVFIVILEIFKRKQDNAGMI
jgi:hypothetical protein